MVEEERSERDFVRAGILNNSSLLGDDSRSKVRAGDGERSSMSGAVTKNDAWDDSRFRVDGNRAVAGRENRLVVSRGRLGTKLGFS